VLCSTFAKRLCRDTAFGRLSAQNAKRKKRKVLKTQKRLKEEKLERRKAYNKKIIQ